MFSSPQKRNCDPCIVKNCESNGINKLNVHFHQFPKPNQQMVDIKNAFGKVEKVDRLKAWKIALKLNNITPKSKVCSLHFKKSDYILPDVPGKKKCLKKIAVPFHCDNKQNRPLRLEERLKKTNKTETMKSITSLMIKEEPPETFSEENNHTNIDDQFGVLDIKTEICKNEIIQNEVVQNEVVESKVIQVDNTYQNKNWNNQVPTAWFVTGSNLAPRESLVRAGNPPPIDLYIKTNNPTPSTGSFIISSNSVLPTELFVKGKDPTLSTESFIITASNPALPTESFIKLSNPTPPSEFLIVNNHAAFIPSFKTPYNPLPLVKDFEVQVDICSFCENISTDKELTTATGIDSFKVLNRILKILNWDQEYKLTRKKMSLKDKVIMTFVKLKHDISYSFLSLIFRCYTPKHVQSIVFDTIKLLCSCLKPVMIWPSKEEIRKNMPKCFELFDDIKVILDYPEILIQRRAELYYLLLYQQKHILSLEID